MKAIFFLIALVAAGGALAAVTAVGRFSSGDLAGWEEQTLRGKKKSVYTLVREGERTVLKAESRGYLANRLPKRQPHLTSTRRRTSGWSPWRAAASMRGSGSLKSGTSMRTTRSSLGRSPPGGGRGPHDRHGQHRRGGRCLVRRHNPGG